MAGLLCYQLQHILGDGVRKTADFLDIFESGENKIGDEIHAFLIVTENLADMTSSRKMTRFLAGRTHAIHFVTP
jgi:hypothetical protein